MKRRKTGGRQKGTPNKSTVNRQQEITASGLLPLEYMLGVLRDDGSDSRRRDWAAKEAAPYIHSRLSSVSNEHTGKDGGPIVFRTVYEDRDEALPPSNTSPDRDEV